MNHTKHLCALAIALAVPITTAASASAGTPPEAATATTTTTTGRTTTVALADPGDDRTRVLGELSTEGRTPTWYDPQRLRLASGGAATGPHQSVDSLSPGPWCVYQCIASGVAYAHGDGVELVLKTKVPADIQLIVCRDDDGDFDCDYLATDWTLSETEFHWVIDPLPAGTYWVTAGATDATGTSHAFGEFTLS